MTGLLHRRKSKMSFAQWIGEPLKYEGQKKYWDYLNKVGFPHRSQEKWKYLDISQWADSPWCLSETQSAQSGQANGSEEGVLKNAQDVLDQEEKQAIEELKIPDTDTIVFVDGVYAPTLSSHPANYFAKEQGVSSDDRDYKDDKNHNDNKDYNEKNLHYFSALTHLKAQTTNVLKLGPHQKANRPVHLIHWYRYSHLENQSVFIPQKMKILLGEGAVLNLIETIDGSQECSGGEFLSSSVIEIELSKKSCLDFCRIHKNPHQQAINYITVKQNQDSSFFYLSADIDNKFIRNDVYVSVEGPHCETSVDGLFFLGKNQTVDNHTHIDQKFPNCSTHQLYKGVLAENAHGVFDGKVVIHPDAQKVNVEQLNKNLLLGEHAKMDTKPNLEIFADDVKASHGATVGQLEPEELFYLQARGISPSKALELVTLGFLKEVSFRLRQPQIRQVVERWILERRF